MKTSHTPGPWSVPHFAKDNISCNCAYIFAGEYLGGIAEVYIDNGKQVFKSGNDCPPIDEAKANAILIAAAPDLLAALQGAEVLFACHCKDATAANWLDAARAAIAKATGEPNEKVEVPAP